MNISKKMSDSAWTEGLPLNMLPVSRLQMPHLVAAKMSSDEFAGFVTIDLHTSPRSRAEAHRDWLNLAESFPNLRTRFIRDGRHVYQLLDEVGDCAARLHAHQGGTVRFQGDSFSTPCIYVWDQETNSASLRVHHALVDSFSVAKIRSRREQFVSADYEGFLREVHSAAGQAYAQDIKPCMVQVEADDEHRVGYRVRRARLLNSANDRFSLDGEFSFWFACFFDTLAQLEIQAADHVLVPVSFRDLLGSSSEVPGLASASVAVDASPPGCATADVRGRLLNSMRERSERIAVASWSAAGKVPLQFAYDDSPSRRLHARHLFGTAGFEVVKQPRGEYLFVCSAGAGSRFTGASVEEMIRVFITNAERRGVVLGT